MRTMSSVLPANYYLLLLFIVVLILGQNYSSAFVTTVQQPLLQRQNKYVLYYLPNNDDEHAHQLEEDLVFFDIMTRTTNNHHHNYDDSNWSQTSLPIQSKAEFENDGFVHPLDRACHALMRQEEQTRGEGKGGRSFEDDLTSQIKMWQGWDAQQGQRNEHDGFY